MNKSYNFYNITQENIINIHQWLPHIKNLGITAVRLNNSLLPDSPAEIFEKMRSRGLKIVIELAWTTSDISDPDSLKHWINTYRVDGVFIKQAHKADRNLLMDLRQICKSENPDFWLAGEIESDNYNSIMNNKMLDCVTNFTVIKANNILGLAYALHNQTLHITPPLLIPFHRQPKTYSTDTHYCIPSRESPA